MVIGLLGVVLIHLLLILGDAASRGGTAPLTCLFPAFCLLLCGLEMLEVLCVFLWEVQK